MKRIGNLKKMFVLAGICIFCSCSPKQVHKVTIALDNACTLEQQTIAYEVIKKRMSIWGVKEKTDLMDGKFDLTYTIGLHHNPDAGSLLTQILTQRGEIYITEIYQQDEIQSPLCSVYERLLRLMENTDREPLWRIDDFQTITPDLINVLLGLMENTDHKPLWRINGFQTVTPDLINVPAEQVSYIDSVFNSMQQLFPAGMSFAWTAKPNKEGFFDLLPLKNFRKLPLNPNTVKKSSFIKNYEGLQELLIELNKEYTEEWASMTRNNIDRSLAIVMDGKILMYPRVHSEIVGGKLVIVGNYDNNELSLIKSVIASGVLGCKTQIINQ